MFLRVFVSNRNEKKVKTWICYMDTNSFIINIKTKYFYKDIGNDVDQRFDTLNYDCDRPSPTGTNKNVIGLIKDELGGKIKTEFIALRAKTCSYLMNDNIENKMNKRVCNKKNGQIFGL